MVEKEEGKMTNEDKPKDEPKPLSSNYPPNSHKSKQPEVREPKREKVVTGEVVQRKKPLGRRIMETFTGEDIRSVGAYILFEVILPAAKSMISDAASQGVERMLFGDSYKSSSGRRAGYVSYNRMSRSDNDRPTVRGLSQQARATHNFDEVILPTRGDAEEVLDGLKVLISQYKLATVSDLYDLVGITGSYTDETWGWTDLRGSSVRRVRDGYLLILPPTESIR